MRTIRALALTTVTTALAVVHSPHHAIALAAALAVLAAVRVALQPLTLDGMLEETATMTARDAERYLGIPRSSVSAWASNGPAKQAKGIEPKLYPVGRTRKGDNLFSVARLVELRDSTHRRTTHARPLAQRQQSI